MRKASTAASRAAGSAPPITAVATITSQRSLKAIDSADFAQAPRPPRLRGRRRHQQPCAGAADNERDDLPSPHEYLDQLGMRLRR